MGKKKRNLGEFSSNLCQGAYTDLKVSCMPGPFHHDYIFTKLRKQILITSPYITIGVSKGSSVVKVHTACIDQRHVHEDTASFKSCCLHTCI